MASASVPAAGNGAGDVSPTANANPAAPPNPKMRKRTKTGCLTCRKRRIKCGEERPTCANCIKSKRQCEGYNQRVIFKTPLEGWPNHPGVVSTLQYHNSMLPGTRNPGFRPAPSPTPTLEGSLTSIQPRPLTQFEFSDVGPALGPLGNQNNNSNYAPLQPYGQDATYPQPLPSPHQQQPLSSPHPHQPLQSPHSQVPPPANTSYFSSAPAPASSAPNTFHSQYDPEPTVGYDEQRYSQAPYQSVPAPYDAHLDQKPAVSQSPQEQPYYQTRQPAATRPLEQSPYPSQTAIPQPASEYPAQTPEARPSIHRYGSQSQAPAQPLPMSSADFSQASTYSLPLAVSLATSSHSNFQPVQIPQHDVTSDVKYMHQHAVYGMSRV